MTVKEIKKEPIDAKTRILYLVLALIFASIFQYAYSLGNEFVWDSSSIFQDDLTIRDFKYLPDYFSEDFWKHVPIEGKNDRLAYYRPLTKTLHLVEYHLFGANPIGYNAVNILLNAACVIAGFFLVLEIVGKVEVAFFAALLYAVNPSRVEAVSWAYSDSYLVHALLSLVSLYCYKKKRYIMSLFCYGLSLLSHEMAILLIPVLIVYEIIFGDRPVNVKGLLRRAASFFGLTLLYLVLRSWAVGAVPVSDLAPGTLFNTAAVVIARYTKIFMLPDSSITIYPLELFTQVTREVVFSYLVVLVLSGFGVYLWITKRQYAFWYSWFFIWIALTFNIGRLGAYLMADKAINLASFGFCTLIALYIRNIRRETIALPLAVCLVLFHSLVTFSRIPYWRNNLVMLEQAVKFAPHFYLSNYHLGLEYAKKGEYEKAIPRFRAAAANPGFSYAYCNLGNSYFMLGMGDNARRAWENAIQIDPANPMPYYNMGLVAEAGGNTRKAAEYYRSFLYRLRSPSPAEVQRVVEIERKLKQWGM